MGPLTGGGCPAHDLPTGGPRAPASPLESAPRAPPLLVALTLSPCQKRLTQRAAVAHCCSSRVWIRTRLHLLSSLWPLSFLNPCPLSGQVGSQVPHESEEALPLAWVGSGLILLTACHHAVPACGAQVSLDLMWHLKAMVSVLGAP